MRKIVLAVLVVALVVVGGAFGWVHISANDRVYTASDAPNRDVALVLGAGLDADGTPGQYLSGRLDEAVSLYEQGKVKVVLVSGDNRTEGYSEPGAMRTYLIEAGLPEGDVIADYAGLDTYDSCYRARNIFGVTSLTVVGQSYHIDRAVATCRSLGIDNTIGVGNEQPHTDGVWRSGTVREIGANVKLVWDRVAQRKPILGQQETSVTEARARHAG